MQRDWEEEVLPLNVKKITPLSIKPLDIQLIARQSQNKQHSFWDWAGSFFSNSQEDERVNFITCQMLIYSLEIKTSGQVWADLIQFYAKLPDHDSHLAQLIRKTVEEAFKCVVPTWRVKEIHRHRYGSVPIKTFYTVTEVADAMKAIVKPKNLLLHTPNRRLASC